jgi:catechol 2,3-dioxygenase-like lactoylglutathione lyase family enzyme
MKGGHVRSATTASIRFESAVPQFTVPDVVRTAEYYRDVLGFEIAGYWDGEQVHRDVGKVAVFGIVQRDHVRLHFNRADEPEVRTVRAEDAYDVYFHVTGVDALADELRSRGADILDGPEDRVYEQRELVVRDANGLILAFGEDTRRRAT